MGCSLCKAPVLSLDDAGAFLSIIKRCSSAHELLLLSFTLVIVTVTETTSDTAETLLEE